MIILKNFFSGTQTFTLNQPYSNDYLSMYIIRETLNQIINLLVLLIVTLFILPVSALMYANGSPDNNDGASDSGSTDNSDSSPSDFLPDNVDSSSDSGSTDNSDSSPSDFLPDNVDSSSDSGSTDVNADSSTTTTENNSTLPSESQLSNNTGNVQGEDLVSIILTLHNQERAAVGVPPLTWSDTLAAHAQPWADNVYATGDASHSSGRADFGFYGENMARGGGPSYATPSWLAQTWANEKSGYVPGTPASDSTGHYTQMVDKQSTEVGCGFTSGAGGLYAEYGGTNVLVCQYTPPGNWNSQPPY
jgi:pathogenesis-related protein 1